LRICVNASGGVGPTNFKTIAPECRVRSEQGCSVVEVGFGVEVVVMVQVQALHDAKIRGGPALNHQIHKRIERGCGQRKAR
jgi:hypothetical protein